MKKKLLFTGLILSVAFITVIVLIINYVDTSFATEISLKYYYNDKRIDATVTDENDIKVLNENLKGVSYIDSPACDCCNTARIGSSNKYVNIKDRIALEAVLEKYGFTFPCE